MVRKKHNPLKNALAGLLPVLVLGATFAILPAGATRYSFDPSEEDFDGIVIGAQVKTPEDTVSNSEFEKIIIIKTLDYIQTGFSEYNLKTPVIAGNEFPSSCYFGTENSVNHVSGKEGKKEILYLFIHVNANEKLEPTFIVLDSCPNGSPRAGIEIPKNFSGISKEECLISGSDDLVGITFCKIKPELDLIIWGMTHPEKN